MSENFPAFNFAWTHKTVPRRNQQQNIVLIHEDEKDVTNFHRIISYLFIHLSGVSMHQAIMTCRVGDLRGVVLRNERWFGAICKPGLLASKIPIAPLLQLHWRHWSSCAQSNSRTDAKPRRVRNYTWCRRMQGIGIWVIFELKLDGSTKARMPSNLLQIRREPRFFIFYFYFFSWHKWK